MIDVSKTNEGDACCLLVNASERQVNACNARIFCNDAFAWFFIDLLRGLEFGLGCLHSFTGTLLLPWHADYCTLDAYVKRTKAMVGVS